MSKVQYANPLELLRYCFMNKETIELNDNMLVFPNSVKISISTPVPWVTPDG